jgi:Flp pilus assembly pilin Flp
MVFKMRLSDERGQDLVEYALLTGGIAIVLIVGVGLFATGLNKWFSDLAGKLPLL